VAPSTGVRFGNRRAKGDLMEEQNLDGNQTKKAAVSFAVQ
jgi:hypothetical protein